MDVIEPIEITDARIISSNLVDEALAWSATKEYQKGDVCAYGGVIYEDASSIDVSDIPVYDETTEYISGDKVKVAAENAVYQALRGAISYNFNTWQSDGVYYAGNYVKIPATKGVYLCKAGENPTSHDEYSLIKEYKIGDTCKVSPSDLDLNNGNISNQTRIYKALRGSDTDKNLGKTPNENLTGSIPYWSLLGICNVNCPPDTSVLYEEWAAYDEDNNPIMYEVGDVVKIDTSGAAYVCLIQNTNCKPSTNLIGSSPKWKYLESFDCNRLSTNYLWELTDALNVGIDPATSIKEDTDNPSWKKLGTYNINMEPDLNVYVAATSDSDAIGTWYDNGASNSKRMLDTVVDTMSVADEEIILVIDTSLCDSIALFNVVGTDIEITVVDNLSGETTLDENISLVSDTASDWYDVFFTYPTLMGNFSRAIPSSTSSKTTLKIKNAGYIAKLGHLVIGFSRNIGLSQFQLSKSMNNYSKISTDEFGRTSISEGTYAFKSDVQVILNKGTESSMEILLASLRAKPCVWLMDNISRDDGPTTGFFLTYALYQSLSITIERHEYSIVNIELLSIA